jgi:SAM-dependent methyltransferase
MAEADSLFAEAQALHRAGHLPQAREFYAQVLRITPQHDGALHGLGLIAFRQGDGRAAALHFAEASAMALARGDGDTALQRAVEALTAQETPATRRLFADVAGTLRFGQDDPVLRPLLARAIAEKWGPLAPLAAAAGGLVMAAGGARADDALLRIALTAAPVTGTGLETALTLARRDLLERGGDAGFAAALAQQCFLNGYVWWQTEAEAARVESLRARVEAGGASDTDVAILACYLPLHSVRGAEAFTGDILAPLLRQQRDEPAEEKAIAATLPALTPVAVDGDDTPWPRWPGLPAAETPLTLRAYLERRFASADLGTAPERPALLVAGCGTGQYALYLARALALDSVTAIDLSRAALAYAARKARDAGLAVTFGQGDILQAAALGRRFGLIECGGVLHQLPDPFAGWAALLEALEPGGVMRVAMHSTVARETLKPLQAQLAHQGFGAGDIRAARHWLITQNDPVLEVPAFFTLESCRHLLFPGTEQPLALPDIARFLRDRKLHLIGLEVPQSVRAAYRARFPQDAAATDLDNWAVFEQENPRTFAAMIQFWVQKRG